MVYVCCSLGSLFAVYCHLFFQLGWQIYLVAFAVEVVGVEMEGVDIF